MESIVILSSFCYNIAVQVCGGMSGGAVDMEPYYPLKEGEEAHWEVTMTSQPGHMTCM